MSCPDAFPRQKNGVMTRIAVPRETPKAENHPRKAARASDRFGPWEGDVISRSRDSNGGAKRTVAPSSGSCAPTRQLSDNTRAHEHCKHRGRRARTNHRGSSVGEALSA